MLLLLVKIPLSGFNYKISIYIYIIKYTQVSSNLQPCMQRLHLHLKTVRFQVKKWKMQNLSEMYQDVVLVFFSSILTMSLCTLYDANQFRSDAVTQTYVTALVNSQET